jgi:hypothetical protein
VAAVAWRDGRLAGLARTALGGAVALAIGLSPFIVSGRLHHLARLWDYMSTNSTANHVISANAHNLWWLPTLLQGRWIEDWEPAVGPLAYRWIGVGLVLVVLGACLAVVLRSRPGPDLYLLTALLGVGWFCFTPRAHEYHAFFVLPFLAVAWPAEPRRRLPLYVAASLALLANLALHDPLVVGALAAPLTPESPLPGWYVALTLANVALFFGLLAGLVGALQRGRVEGRQPVLSRVVARA